MATTAPVNRSAGTSLTKAGMGIGLRQSQQQQQCVAIWVQKHPVAGCLA